MFDEEDTFLRKKRCADVYVNLLMFQYMNRGCVINLLRVFSLLNVANMHND